MTEKMVPLSEVEHLLRNSTSNDEIVDGIKKITSEYSDHPEGLMGRWAKHRTIGRVLIIDDKPDFDGTVKAAFIDDDDEGGSDWQYFEFSSLTLEERPQRKILRSRSELMAVPDGTVIAANDYSPLTRKKTNVGDYESASGLSIKVEDLGEHDFFVLRRGWRSNV